MVVPLALLYLQPWSEPGEWTMPGSAWSLAAGAAGAVGALGIILAFNFGGKPIYVMPLVFGGAPVVNTLITILGQGAIDLEPQGVVVERLPKGELDPGAAEQGSLVGIGLLSRRDETEHRSPRRRPQRCQSPIQIGNR